MMNYSRTLYESFTKIIMLTAENERGGSANSSRESSLERKSNAQPTPSGVSERAERPSSIGKPVANEKTSGDIKQETESNDQFQDQKEEENSVGK